MEENNQSPWNVKMYQFVYDNVQKALQGTVNERVTKETLETVKTTVQSILNKADELNPFKNKDVVVGDVSRVWDKMSYKERMAWFVLNVMPFKWVGDDLRSRFRSLVDSNWPVYLESDPKNMISAEVHTVFGEIKDMITKFKISKE